MHCFFDDTLTETSTELHLSRGEAHHAVRVLRLRDEDEILLVNGHGTLARATITLAGSRKEDVICNILNINKLQRKTLLRLYIAPPKSKNMELLIKMATELGVAQITPILCQYGVSKPETEKEAWLQAAVTACKQSKNPWLPEFDAPIPFQEALQASQELSFLGAVPSADTPRPAASPAASKLALWIGPEGGFSPEETQALFNKGAIPLTIGPCILRVETAVPALLGAIYTLIERS